MSAIGYSNGSAPSGGTFPNATPTPMVPMADPCPEITGCANIVANPPSSSGCTALTQSGGTISPGCYSSLTLSGAITLSPGTYVLTGTTTLTGSPGVTSLTGTGVTFYVTSSATAPNFAIAATGSLSAPTSGTYQNVLYYQVPSNTTNPSFGLSGGLVNLSGLIYASGATNVAYCCTTGSVVLVFGGATFASISGEPSPPPNAVTIPTQLTDYCERGARTMMLQTLFKKGRMLRCDAGAALVEFALFLPPLIFAWMGMVELGRYMAYATLAQASARAGTEYGIINLMYAHDLSNTTTWATSDAQYLPAGFTVTSKYLCSVNGALPPTTCPSTSPPVNNVYYIQVTVTGTYTPWFTYPGIPSSAKVSGTTYTAGE